METTDAGVLDIESLPPVLYWYDIDEIMESEWSLVSDDDGNQLVVVEGDIVLGSPAEAMEQHLEIAARLLEGDTDAVDKALLDTRQRHIWVDGLIRFELSSEFYGSPEAEADAAQIRRAAEEWNKWSEVTGLTWEERDLNKRQSGVLFKRMVINGGCRSKNIGRDARRRTIYLNTADCFSDAPLPRGMGPFAGAPCARGRCAPTTIMHEMGHMMGMRHEQRRHDRNKHILVMDDNMLEDMRRQSKRYRNNAPRHRAMGSYDTASLMHYPSDAFTDTARVKRGAYLPVHLQRDVIDRIEINWSALFQWVTSERARHNRQIRLGGRGIDLDRVEVVDIEGDGLDDLLTEHEGELVWSHRGESGWRPIRPTGERVTARIATSAVGDLTGNRGIDLLRAVDGSWTLHATDGSRNTARRGRSVRRFAVADVDGDGIRDVFVLWDDRSFGLARGGDVLGPVLRLSSEPMGVDEVKLVRLQGAAGPVHAVAWLDGALVYADLSMALASGDARWKAVFAHGGHGPLPSHVRGLRSLWFVNVDGNDALDIVTWSDGRDGSGMPARSPCWVRDVRDSAAIGMEPLEAHDLGKLGVDLSQEVAVGHFTRAAAEILSLGEIYYPTYPSWNDIFALGTLYADWSTTRLAKRYPLAPSGNIADDYDATVAIGERIEWEAAFMSPGGLGPVRYRVLRLHGGNRSDELSSKLVTLSGERDSVRGRFEANQPGRYRVEIALPSSSAEVPGGEEVVARWDFAVTGPVCGDGRYDFNEVCDDGAANSDSEPDRCRSTCTLHRCGDGVIDSGESCDEGSANGDLSSGATCLTNCALPTCGDGIVDPGEGCDLGAGNSDTTVIGCRTTCVEPYCGDGVPGVGERCDEGSNNSDGAPDACRRSCVLPYCGDGVVDAGETCDGTLGCLSDCTCNPDGFFPADGFCAIIIDAG